MNLIIKGTNTTLTPADKEFIVDKLSVLEKFLKPEDKVHVEIEIVKKHSSGLTCRAEIGIKPHGHYAESMGIDFYAAVDIVVPKIKEQLTKKKDKAVSLRRKKAAI